MSSLPDLDLDGGAGAGAGERDEGFVHRRTTTTTRKGKGDEVSFHLLFGRVARDFPSVGSFLTSSFPSFLF